FCIENIAEDGNDAILIIGKDGNGVLYGVFDFIRSICCGKTIEAALKVDFPRNSLRIIDHWDNIDGKIERGYAGESILYRDNAIVKDKSRVRDYARLLASIGINGIVVNNVNVHKEETKFVTEDYLPEIRGLSNVFSEFGIKIYLSINFAAPIEVGNLPTADPLDPLVKKWWADT
ncbi:MAG TPA: alpha-glucuronidase, partial [Clostridiales bacterium]|nr:alpha-glucuronidase [Clostridiales bacterium]